MSDLDIVWSRSTAGALARQLIADAEAKVARREAARKRAEARREAKQEQKEVNNV